MLSFKRANLPGMDHVTAYVAVKQPWQFRVIQDQGHWTASHRLMEDAIRPEQSVSASSTILGPFDTFAEAVAAATDKWHELKRMS